MKQDFIEEAGSAFLAHRLKRLSDLLVTDIAAVLETQELTVPATAGSTLVLLIEHDRLGVTEIAERLRLTHPFIVRLVARLEALDLVSVSPDPADLRRKWVALTTKGASEAAVLKRLNAALEAVFQRIAEQSGVNLLDCVRRFEAELAATPFFDRLTKQLATGATKCPA